MCRICKEKKLVTTYEEKMGICLECQDEIAQFEAKIFDKRRFPQEEQVPRRVRGTPALNRYESFN